LINIDVQIPAFEEKHNVDHLLFECETYQITESALIMRHVYALPSGSYWKEVGIPFNTMHSWFVGTGDEE